MFGMSSVAFPGAADAVQQASLCTPDDAADGVGAPDADSAVSIVGLSTPNQMKPFVENGCVKSVVLWNPIDLGYAAVYAMRAIVDGELTPGKHQPRSWPSGHAAGRQWQRNPPRPALRLHRREHRRLRLLI